MSPVDVNLLNPHSRAFAQALFAVHPGWRAHAQAHDEGEAFSVTLASPADHECQLWISTEDQDITIGFDHWHGHWFEPAEALEMITAFLTDEAVVVSGFTQARWPTAFWLPKHEALELNGRVAEWGATHGYTRFRQRSWQGSLNIDLTLTGDEA